MKLIIRKWKRESDFTFFRIAELEAFKGTLDPSVPLTDEQILAKFKKMDEEDPIDVSDSSHQVFIAAKEGRSHVGLIWLCNREPFWRFEKRLAWIYNLYIVPEFRKQGIARKLMATGEQWTREQNLQKIALHVIEWNTAARNLYESMGYELVSTHNESCFYEKLLI